MLLFALGCAVSHEGTYTLQLVDTTSDCVAAPTGAERLELTITETEAGDWRVAPADEACTPRTDGFDCEVSTFDEEADYETASVDAIVGVDLDLAGTWRDAGLTAVVTYAVTCAGTACANLGSGTPERCSTAWTYR